MCKDVKRIPREGGRDECYLLGTELDLFSVCIAFVRNVVNAVGEFLSDVLNARNHYLLTALPKLTRLEGLLHLQRFLWPP